jgi:Family of unknown function (DUF6492)
MLKSQIAIITPSYEGDRDRCVLLCESMDRMARGDWHHYVLVADHDMPLFEHLAGPRRSVIPDSVILPKWLKPIRNPFNSKARWRWISTKLTSPVLPMTGWHVQQLRKILVARIVDAPIMIMADSDSVMLRPFGPELFIHGETLRLQVIEKAIRVDIPTFKHHVIWNKVAAQLLGLPSPAFPADDYIHNLVSWRREHALAMINHIEKTQGRDMVSAIGRHRTFSEYQIYGAYVKSISGGAEYWPDSKPLCHTYWNGDALTQETFDVFTASLKPEQIAICVQSFTDTSVGMIRDYMDKISAIAADS